MEIFYTHNVENGFCTLGEEEAAHCVKVLRHREGDRISVIDGEGTYYDCTVVSASPRSVSARIDGVQTCWGSHGYRLTMAVCPTKNADRFEWFAEKATEFGVDRIVPLIGEHSERRVLKTDRIRKILLSATKQSLKGAVPVVSEPVTVLDFVAATAGCDALKMIAYCFEGEGLERHSIVECLQEAGCGFPQPGETFPDAATLQEIIILIGPEGDFSRNEALAAIQAGYTPVHLGASRLRTETAALAAVSAVYFSHVK